MIVTARELIEELDGEKHGALTRMAKRLGVTRQMVGKAVARNHIPATWHYRLAAWARAAKLNVNPALFGEKPDGKEVHSAPQPQQDRDGQRRRRGQGQALGQPTSRRASGESRVGDARQPGDRRQADRRGAGAATAAGGKGIADSGFYDRFGNPLKIK